MCRQFLNHKSSTIMRRFYIISFIAIIALFAISLMHGSIDIPCTDVAGILLGRPCPNASWEYIVLQTRLPQALTAMLAGAALSVSGLLLQTTFRNPLAAPDIFGVTSGASLAMALLTLAPTALAGEAMSGLPAVAAAFLGAIAVTALIWMASRIVRSSVMLIIIGIMVGYVASSAITLLNFFATDEGVKSYMVWGMGSFGNVSMSLMPVFVIVTLLGFAGTLLLIKPLNALLLGDRYAENLGVNIQRTRNWLLFVTGLLTAVTTTFCGPVAFIGLAVPHMVRLVFITSNHRILLPATILMGAVVALLCNLICFLPGEAGVIPLNAVTPLIGAPVIIYVILKGRGK